MTNQKVGDGCSAGGYLAAGGLWVFEAFRFFAHPLLQSSYRPHDLALEAF
jgi:hypothetical protein